MTENTKRHLKRIFNKDMLFYLLILAIIIVYSIFHANNLVKVTFDEDSVYIKAPKYTMDIPYDLVESIKLSDLAEAGEETDGWDDSSTRTGVWKNNSWGEYYACLDLAAETCIVVHLTDGRTFVFSRNNAEETAEIFATLQTHLK